VVCVPLRGGYRVHDVRLSRQGRPTVRALQRHERHARRRLGASTAARSVQPASREHARRPRSRPRARASAFAELLRDLCSAVVRSKSSRLAAPARARSPTPPAAAVAHRAPLRRRRQLLRRRRDRHPPSTAIPTRTRPRRARTASRARSVAKCSAPALPSEGVCNVRINRFHRIISPSIHSFSAQLLHCTSTPVSLSAHRSLSCAAMRVCSPLGRVPDRRSELCRGVAQRLRSIFRKVHVEQPETAPQPHHTSTAITRQHHRRLRQHKSRSGACSTHPLSRRPTGPRHVAVLSSSGSNTTETTFCTPLRCTA
jgi:hypothetical protein